MRSKSVAVALISGIACVAMCTSSPWAASAQTAVLATPRTAVLAAPRTAVPAAPRTAVPATARAPMSTGAPVASGVEAPASAIPWESVGPGWFVAMWGPHAAVFPGPAIEKWQQQRTTLFLVDPRGGRYLIATLPAPSLYQMFDWSGDGRRVLIGAPTTAADPKSQVEEIDLVNGKVLSHFTSSSSNAFSAWYEFTRPTGLALLRSSQAADGTISVTRLSLSGETERSYATKLSVIASVNSAVLPSLDGAELVVAAAHGLALYSNSGTFLKDIGPYAKTCSPDRWWDETDLVASCETMGPDSTSVAALWLVPVNGRAPSQLTFPKAPDYGDVNGWKVGNTVYVQALGACGSEFLARRLANGTTREVKVPKAANDERVIGAGSTGVAVQAVLGCGGGQSLFWFDPSTGKDTPLLGPLLNGGGVLAALPYPGLQP